MTFGVGVAWGLADPQGVPGPWGLSGGPMGPPGPRWPFGLPNEPTGPFRPPRALVALPEAEVDGDVGGETLKV